MKRVKRTISKSPSVVQIAWGSGLYDVVTISCLDTKFVSFKLLWDLADNCEIMRTLWR